MIRGTKRALVSAPDTGAQEKKTVDLALMARIHNRWDVEVVDAATGEVKQRARGFNVICDGWWANIPNASGSVSYIQYGGGSGTPAASDTALFSRIGSKSVSMTEDTSTIQQDFVSWQYSIQLAPADAVGETITEVGLATGQTSGLLTHAMLQDMNGNPISITKTATDIVNIYATIFLHIETDRYASGKIRITKNVTWMRGFGLTTGSYVRISVAPYQTAAYDSKSDTANLSSGSYDAATKTTSMSFVQLQAAAGNCDGGALFLAFGYYLGSPNYNNRNAYLIMFPASKSQILNEAVGTGDGSTKNFKTKFAFPSNATIYIDGVAQASGVTVVPDHPSRSSRLDLFLLPIALVTNDGLALLEDFVNSNSSGLNIPASSEQMYEQSMAGIELDTLKISGSSATNTVTISVSDDLETWTDVGATFVSGTTWSIPQTYRNAKYWKIRNNKTSGTMTLDGGTSPDLTGYAIRFDTAPAAGAAITASYQTPMIPKDSDHIMDVSMTVTFGEYTGEES